MLRLCGAEVVEVPGGPVFQSQQLCETIPVVSPPQLAESDPNGADVGEPVRQRGQPPRPFRTTGPEIWRQTDGNVDGFICAVGTGGTLGGVGIALKERKRDQDRPRRSAGAALYTYYTTGELKSEGASITEGIGQGRITENIEGAPIDLAYRIPDEEAVAIIFDLLRYEGLCLGGSSGINVAGAIRLARELGPGGHLIVTVLCDYGSRYQSKLFNPEFLRSKGPAGSTVARTAFNIRHTI